MAASPPRASFLGLPRELRAIIYDHLIPCTASRNDFSPVGTHREYAHAQRRIPFCNCNGRTLLSISAQIRHEVLPFICARHRLFFQLAEHGREEIRTWLDTASIEALAAVNYVWLRRFVGKEIVTSAGSLYRLEHFLVNLLDREGGQVSGGMREQREREQRLNEVLARLPRRESGEA